MSEAYSSDLYPPRDDANGRGQQSPDKAPAIKFPKIDKKAYHGLAGDVVRAIDPHTEAHPVAILIQTLTFFGNVIGRTPHYVVEADKHRGNLFIALTGETAKARKGTSGSRVESIFAGVDDHWCTRSGLSSGEGLITALRDATEVWDREKQRHEIVDPGVADKRLLVFEPEFASALAVMQRQGNTLSPHLRNAWDGKSLSTMTRHPLTATDPHISIVSHITEEELRTKITRTDAANGFGNRFLFLLVRRSKLLPFGGSLDPTELQGLSDRIKIATAFACKIGCVPLSSEARTVWEKIYPRLSASQPGLLGAITARAEAQTIRLALLYALLDLKSEIGVDHLKAAGAVWEYAQASAIRIFGDALGDPVADEILRALQHAGDTGMTRTAIRDLFGRNQASERIGASLGLLAANARARMEHRQTGGRPVETWFRPPGGQWSPLPVRPPRFETPRREDRFTMPFCTGWCSGCGTSSTWRPDPPTSPKATTTRWRCTRCERPSGAVYRRKVKDAPSEPPPAA
jgi:hypothetical protein